MHFAERIASKIERFGEQFTIDGLTYRGMFKPLDSGTLSVYLDDVEKMGVTHPALLLVIAPDVPIDAQHPITRDGRTYNVLKTALHRIGDTPVVKIAILS